jgi:glycosyltransferase involved in cell wall biosynthesis
MNASTQLADKQTREDGPAAPQGDAGTTDETSASAKPLLLVLGSHEPLDDPREKWICEMATASYEVQFLGLQNPPFQKPLVEMWNGYPVYRLHRDAKYDPRSLHELIALAQDAQERRYWTRWWLELAWILNGLWDFSVGVARLPRRAVVFGLALYDRWLALRQRAARLWQRARGLFGAIRGRQRSVAAATQPLPSVEAAPAGSSGAGAVERIRDRVFPRAQRWEIGMYEWIERHFDPLYRLFQFKWLISNHFIKVASMYMDYMEQLPAKPQVIHCNDLETLIAGYWAKRRYGAVLVYDSHEYFAYSDIDAPSYHIRYFQALERRLVRHCDAFTTVNPVLGSELEKDYGVPVRSVPNAEPWVENDSPPPAGEITALAAGRVRFLFQGNFASDRGIAELIRAWPHVDGQRAALFLRGMDNRWRDELIALARKLGVLDRSVYFPAAVHVADLVNSAAEADIGLIPYRPVHRAYKFCCPNKLSQYLHAGLMIVSNDLPYVRQVLEESGTGLWYRDADAKSISDAVMRAASDDALRERCKQNAKKYGRTVFNWQNYGRVFLDLYKSRPYRSAA